MTPWKASAGVVLFTLWTTGAAFAQGTSPAVPATPVTKPSNASTVAGDPTVTTASYEDWTVQCTRTGDGDSAKKSCGMVETLALPGQTQPVARVIVESVDKTPSFRLTAVMPTLVSFDKSPSIGGAAGSPALFDLTWRRCLPDGCFADVSLNADALKTLRARTEPANLLFQDAGVHDVSLALSMRGFPQALDALQKETSAR